jgi:CheY-like chemotaxis protein
VLFLPLVPDSTVARQPKGDEVIPFGNGELVLVVEDDATVRETVLQRLEAIGYAVLEAGNAQTALEMIAAGEPVDLVFSDVVMPGRMSGFDLARRIETDYPGIPVLLTSGHVSQALRTGSGAGLSPPVLSKPYLLRDLARAVARAIRPEEPSS